MQVSAAAVVDGATVRDRAAGHGRQRGRDVAAVLELLPAEPVEHEQHDLVGLGRDRRAARRAEWSAVRAARARRCVMHGTGVVREAVGWSSTPVLSIRHRWRTAANAYRSRRTAASPYHGRREGLDPR